MVCDGPSSCLRGVRDHGYVTWRAGPPIMLLRLQPIHQRQQRPWGSLACVLKTELGKHVLVAGQHKVIRRVQEQEQERHREMEHHKVKEQLRRVRVRLGKEQLHREHQEQHRKENQEEQRRKELGHHMERVHQGKARLHKEREEQRRREKEGREQHRKEQEQEHRGNRLVGMGKQGKPDQGSERQGSPCPLYRRRSWSLGWGRQLGWRAWQHRRVSMGVGAGLWGPPTGSFLTQFRQRSFFDGWDHIARSIRQEGGASIV